ncbi:Uma2 family endonuclease [soil metagenome]
MEMATVTKRWTLDELHRLPDDGNRYEVVHGALFVTPAPTPTHETVCARLTRILVPYVEREQLGLVYHPRAVLRFDGSEVEPDLMVRAEHTGDGSTWSSAPIPSLIVEVLSPTTERRDRNQKRELYMHAGVGEYWLVDAERRAITVIRKGREDVVVTNGMTWHPASAKEPLTFAVSRLFD